MSKEKILLAHGSGGKLMHQLIREVFLAHLKNPILSKLGDAAALRIGKERLCFTTDSFVVKPVFFPGGDIGSLSVYGTVNDLAMMGSQAVYLSLGLIISEGFAKEDLEKIIASIGQAAKKAGVVVATGDTKVIERKVEPEIFINTSGIGVAKGSVQFSRQRVKIGDKIILSGTLADHGLAVLAARGEFNFRADFKSDTAALNHLVANLLKFARQIKFMRDPTRGGLATTLNELVEGMPFGIKINEAKIPLRKSVGAACDLLGLDPLYIGNEGKLVMVVSPQVAGAVLKQMRKDRLGKQASIIGQITPENKGLVVLETLAGGERLVEMLSGEPIPRIC